MNWNDVPPTLCRYFIVTLMLLMGAMVSDTQSVAATTSVLDISGEYVLQASADRESYLPNTLTVTQAKTAVFKVVSKETPNFSATGTIDNAGNIMLAGTLDREPFSCVGKLSSDEVTLNCRSDQAGSFIVEYYRVSAPPPAGSSDGNDTHNASVTPPYEMIPGIYRLSSSPEITDLCRSQAPAKIQLAQNNSLLTIDDMQGNPYAKGNISPEGAVYLQGQLIASKMAFQCSGFGLSGKLDTICYIQENPDHAHRCALFYYHPGALPAPPPPRK